MSTILIIAIVHLTSFMGMMLFTETALEEGQCTSAEYSVGFYWAMVPGVNTLLLILNIVTWLVHRLSYGK